MCKTCANGVESVRKICATISTIVRDFRSARTTCVDKPAVLHTESLFCSHEFPQPMLVNSPPLIRMFYPVSPAPIINDER